MMCPRLGKNPHARLVAVVLAAIVAATLQDRVEAQPAPPRKTAPLARMRDSSGTAVTLQAYRGRVVLLNVWATWCAGCKLEIPWLMEFQDRYGARGLVTLGVAMDDEGWDRVAPYVKAHPFNYRILAGDAAFAKAYGLAAMPTTILVDREGRIAATHAGVIDKAEWDRTIRQVLSEPSRHD